jgi:hypothetical protein
MKISKLQTILTRGSTKTIDEAIGDAAITRVAELENQLADEQSRSNQLEKRLLDLCGLHTYLMLQCLKAEKTDKNWRKLLNEMYALIEKMRGV